VGPDSLLGADVMFNVEFLLYQDNPARQPRPYWLNQNPLLEKTVRAANH
jgi:hypothetical protein